ncbi:uncharacterized protein LOC123702737 [Colias croceus]|uniref:uncharacterized protein LOC123702737 n=1 Tax=Colias crocea TaxID=72248 RepID=UPI001E27AB2D|nr:uncharacterized protein LOC123702737 [Colias croceus]
MSCELIVRPSMPGDMQKRQEIVRNAYSTGFIDTFFFFFFQELTLECCVLSGAVLFIFCGVSARGCLLLVPAVVAVVSAAVLLQQYTLAHKHAQSIHGEMFGVVVEARGALLPPAGAVPIRLRLNDGRHDESRGYMYTHIVGTASVSEFWGSMRSGWLHSLAVDVQWQRRGAGAALVSSARQLGAGAGLQSLECVVSPLQSAAKRLLQAAGWECRGSYERAVVGAALTLPLLRLGTDLPLA